MRSKFGAIRALMQMRRHASPNVDSSVRYRSMERGAQAITLLSDLLGVLPSGPEMELILGAVYAKRLEIEGMTPEVMRLRDAAKNVKRLLNACRSYSLSADPAAVEEASGLLTRVVSENPALPLAVTPGDFISSNFNGAMICASYPNGSRWELSLRRSHPEYEDMEPGIWLLEGGGFMAAGETPCIEMVLGSSLPPDGGDILNDHVRVLHRYSRAGVRHLHSVPSAASEGEQGTSCRRA